MSSGEAFGAMMAQVLGRQAENGDSGMPELVVGASLIILALVAGYSAWKEMTGNRPDDAP